VFRPLIVIGNSRDEKDVAIAKMARLSNVRQFLDPRNTNGRTKTARHVREMMQEL
jgi:hypothetical protein